MEVISSAGIHAVLYRLQLQVRWTGHIVCLTDEHLLQKIFFGKLDVGRRADDGPKKQYRDTLKSSM